MLRWEDPERIKRLVGERGGCICPRHLSGYRYVPESAHNHMHVLVEPTAVGTSRIIHAVNIIIGVYTAVTS